MGWLTRLQTQSSGFGLSLKLTNNPNKQMGPQIEEYDESTNREMNGGTSERSYQLDGLVVDKGSPPLPGR